MARFRLLLTPLRLLLALKPLLPMLLLPILPVQLQPRLHPGQLLKRQVLLTMLVTPLLPRPQQEMPPKPLSLLMVITLELVQDTDTDRAVL